MYIADANNAKRGPFTDATGRHQMLYSPFHSRSYICGTCHDVSNPVFTRPNVSTTVYTANAMGQPSETFDLRLMFPLERTYSEWVASGYSAPDRIMLKTCQDCHMKDVTGKGAKMNDAPERNNLPLHDLTGGNTFVPQLIKQLYLAEVNAAALDAGVERARNMLRNAAKLELNIDGNVAYVKVTNLTGHKLPTGYPEGRRIWINMRFYGSSGQLLKESGAYDASTGILQYAETWDNGTMVKTKIYECKPGMSQEVVDALNPTRPADRKLTAGPSFHMALNDMIYFDNRIPPPGFTNVRLIEYQSPVVGEGGVLSRWSKLGCYRLSTACRYGKSRSQALLSNSFERIH